MEFSGTDIVSRLNPTVLPTTTEWYVITITNDAGCVTTDSVLIVVDAYKPIYIPNVISPNQDFVNDNLTVYGNIAATTVQSFQIFDRWGGMMWEGRDFPLNDPSLGWDGTHKGKPVNGGVFAYVAIINFVDNIPVTYHGTVTVLR
jgi:gliding motility-associated-like protein